jgi:SAM-dependent methyltransferase
MKSLYENGFEHLYDAMYQTFIDYREEFNFYSTVISQHKKKSVLEIGCGTGHLAKFFISSNIDYIGLDLSQEMINVSQNRNPTGVFITEDATKFKLDNKMDSIIITGRTTSYLLNNKIVTEALKTIHSNLNNDGILCFDFIDASRFLKEIKGGKSITHQAIIDDKHYIRESYIKENITLDNMMFEWDASYYKVEENLKTHITTDKSTVRAFTKNEWELLLELNSFELLEFIDKKSYAFDTYVVVAKKTE